MVLGTYSCESFITSHCDILPRVPSTRVIQLKEIIVLTIFIRAGDAAHSFPPTGGLGLNSGLGDVHNLAYKIALQHHLQLSAGYSPSLLSTYQSERKQIALVNSQQSVKNGLKIFGFLKQMGATDPNVSIAKKNLFARVRSEDVGDVKMIAEGIEGQREHFDNQYVLLGPNCSYN